MYLIHVVRLVAALLLAFVAARATGLEWLACGACEAHAGEEIGCADEEGTEFPCGPSCSDCTCCFNVAYPVPAILAEVVRIEPERNLPLINGRHVLPPEPREILHVPIRV